MREPVFSVGQRVYWDDGPGSFDEDEPNPSECGEVTSVARKLGGFKYTVKYDEDDSPPETLYDEGMLHALFVPEDDR